MALRLIDRKNEALMQDPGQFVVTWDGERWLFRPSGLFVAFLIAMLTVGVAFCVVLAVSFFRGFGAGSLGVWLGVSCLLFAGLFTGMVVWAWWTRDTPLTVERGGRVCFGARELCAAGTVRAVRIAPS